MRVVKLKDICDFQKGETGLAKAEPGNYPLVATGAERKTCNTFQFDTRAVCIPLVSSTGHGHASLKNVHYQEGKFALGTILVALTAKDDQELNIQFLHLYLSQLKDQVLVPLMSGAANVALSVTKIKGVEIPLPSIERQKEIVEQFKSIVLEENQLKGELAHQQTLLTKLRQQILQEAIEGKLTDDWRAANPNVEPASELLKRIATEKAELVKAKKIKKQKALLPISDDEKPFDLPSRWSWCRLGDLAQVNPRNNCDDEMEVGFTPMPLVSSDYFSHPRYEKRKWRDVKKGYTHFAENDVVIAKITPCFENSKCGVITNFPNATGTGTTELHVVRKITSDLNSEFIYLFAKSTAFIENGRRLMKGAVGQKRVPKEYIETTMLCLPPVEEQEAIVRKVKNIFTFCDQLETQITQNQTHADALMQAVLREAFTQGSAEAANA